MIITINDINKDQLGKWINLMDGYHGISGQDKSWVHDNDSIPHKLTLYCYLIGRGFLFVEDRKLKSNLDGYETLIEFIQEFFKGKCIVNFTDLFFLEEINIAFCNNRWHNVQECWLTEREDYLTIMQSRIPVVIREPTAYVVEINSEGDIYDWMYFLLKGKNYTTIIDFCNSQIIWKSVDYTTFQFKKEFSLESSRVTYGKMTLQEFYSRLADVIDLNYGVDLGVNDWKVN